MAPTLYLACTVELGMECIITQLCHSMIQPLLHFFSDTIVFQAIEILKKYCMNSATNPCSMTTSRSKIDEKERMAPFENNSRFLMFKVQEFDVVS